ncbi:glucan biosynthesis protein [Methylocella sp.]|uniref:glucan biosynthesis protein n=1 Tax=Methylocella sp. TaxID=1978226 RepID=UPI003783574C
MTKIARTKLTRRMFMEGLAAAGTLAPVAALAGAPSAAPPQPSRFDFDDVVRRARDLAAAPFDAALAPLPDSLAKLDFDAWRDIRFRPDKAFLNQPGSQYRLQLFHLGHLYKRPVTINILRDGVPTPIPFTTGLFDYGRVKPDKAPVNLGFAGFRLHYPLNSPKVFDEAVAFLGASYFRFLGRDQHYGISARALAIGSGTDDEEFPFFREFWIETPTADVDRATIYGLLDSASTTGAYRFDLYPGVESAMEITAALFPRKPNVRFGLAPLTSMFFLGENDRRFNEDFRPELHDSDGLLIHTNAGEWIWRPLRNPTKPTTSAFIANDVKGFGLMQRDRDFDHYQDIDLNYERRPSYFVEPREPWGQGQVDLVELPTEHEANDNVVAYFSPAATPEPNRAFSYAYRLSASLDSKRLSPNGRVVNTYQTTAAALGAAEAPAPGTRRFIIDFGGGELPFYAADPGSVEVVASTNHGKIVRTFLAPNPHVKGFRAAVDAQLDPGQSADLRAFLRRGSQTLTETWTYPWRAD